MRFPAYWSQATAEQIDDQGRKQTLSCWRSSDTSPEDAHASALAAATHALQLLLSGAPRRTYPYASGPLREQILQRLENAQGQLIAAISQNRYGSLVLNTARVMFVDVDFDPVPPGEQLRHAVGRLFNRGKPSPAELRESAARERIEQFAKDQGWSARLYRTCGGLRMLVTHTLFDPAADATLALLESAGADPLYIRLCKMQGCFRARLTPKPWRCGHHANTVGWPREQEVERARFEAWQAKYLDRQARFATCRHLATIGNGPVSEDVQTVIDVHDRTTRVDESLALA